LIGTQCWTQSNLKVTKYNDGTVIPDITNSSSVPTSGARLEYVGSGVPSSGYVGTYGYLYNWYAVADSRKLCPTGWHVPSDDEWNLLGTYLGGNAGGNMKSTSSLWNIQSAGANNSSGFTALPGGFSSTPNNFVSINSQAYFWTSSEYVGIGPSASINKYISSAGDLFFSFRESRYYGHSIRCLKD